MRSSRRAQWLLGVGLWGAALPGPAPGQEPAAQPPSFDELIEQARALDEDLDFTALRLAWSLQDGYNPYLDSTDLYKETILGLRSDLPSRRFREAVQRCVETAHLYELDIRWHMRCSEAQKGVGDAEAAAFHTYMIRGLIQSIQDSGDGESPASAFRVFTLSEQHAVMAVLRVDKGAQELIHVEGSQYDRITVTDRQTGAERVLYFNVDPLFGWLSRQLESPTEGPPRDP